MKKILEMSQYATFVRCGNTYVKQITCNVLRHKVNMQTMQELL